MKKRNLIINGLIALTLAFPVQANYQKIDGVALLINGEVVTEIELQRKKATFLRQLRQNMPNLPPEEVIDMRVKQDIIMNKIQLSRAKNFGITIGDEELNRTINNIAAENRYTLSQFKKALESEGWNFAEFREFIREGMTTNSLQQREVIARINVTDREVNDFLNNQSRLASFDAEYLVSHILITIPDGATQSDLKAKMGQANELIKKLRAGADFSQAAISYSDGQQAVQGGSLGWRKMAEMPSLFVDQVQRLKPGEIGELIRSSSGLHIIKLVEMKSVEPEKKIIEQTKVSHILIRTGITVSDDVAKGRAEVLYERVSNGEDFATIAKANSDDPGSATNGGDLGWVSKGMMVPEFEKTMLALPKGKISKPFRTQYGWHIMQVEDRREYDSTEEWMKKSAKESIHERKRLEELELWAQRIRSEAYIEDRTVNK